MPLAIDLFCGRGGWAHGLLATGWQVIGFDIADMGGYPGELVLQDVLTIHGSQFRNASLIVASPPCQNYSYLAMPWSRSKTDGSKAAKALRRKWETEGPDNRLFDACFRIQREACETTEACHHCKGTGIVFTSHWLVLAQRFEMADCPGCYGFGKRRIPLIVENVRGAQPWVGQAKANYGSFFLWGDVETVNGSIVAGQIRFGAATLASNSGVKCGGPAGDDWFTKHNTERFGVKVSGQDWNNFKKHGIISPDWKMQAPVADGRKVPGFNFHEHEKTGRPGGSFQSASVKLGGSWFHGYAHGQGPRNHGSGSAARKEASARIAMIPPLLAEYIGRSFLP